MPGATRVIRVRPDIGNLNPQGRRCQPGLANLNGKLREANLGKIDQRLGHAENQIEHLTKVMRAAKISKKPNTAADHPPAHRLKRPLLIQSTFPEAKKTKTHPTQDPRTQANTLVQSLKAPSWWDDSDRRWFTTSTAHEQLFRLYNPVARVTQRLEAPQDLRPGYLAEFVDADPIRQRFLIDKSHSLNQEARQLTTPCSTSTPSASNTPSSNSTSAFTGLSPASLRTSSHPPLPPSNHPSYNSAQSQGRSSEAEEAANIELPGGDTDILVDFSAEGPEKTSG